MPHTLLFAEPGVSQTSWEDAEAPLVLAIDIGSSSVRALTFDARGLQVKMSEQQIPHRLHTSRDGRSEADPGALFELVAECVDRALELASERATDIGAVATSSFWHSLMGVDGSGRSSSPVFMWADKRSGPDVDALREACDAQAMHQHTGCRFHSSYWPAKIMWLRREHPEVVARTQTWCGFPDFVNLQLRGALQTSISMASGTGLLNIADSTWHEPMLDVIGLTPDQLPDLVDRNDALPSLSSSWRSRWRPLADVPWFPALGDGAAANLGTGAVGNDRIAITIGTSGALRVITGDDSTPETPLNDSIWSYRLDRHRRVTGGALSNGGNATGWLARHFAGGDFDVLAAAAGSIPPDGHGLTVLPLFAGERAPSWNDDAAAVFAGMTLATSPGHLYRATLEAIAYRFAAIHEALKPWLQDDHDIYVNGAAALKSPLWLQIISDTLGQSLAALDADAEASARGAAVSALDALGEIPQLRPESPTVKDRYTPDASSHHIYQRGRARQSHLEDAMAAFWEAQ